MAVPVHTPPARALLGLRHVLALGPGSAGPRGKRPADHIARLRPTGWLFSTFESGAISRSWRPNENIGVCDYARAFTTQGTTLRIILVRSVVVLTRKPEDMDLERLVRPVVRRPCRPDG